MTAALAVEVCSYGPCKLVLDSSGSEKFANLTLGLSIGLPIAQLSKFLQQTPSTFEDTEEQTKKTTPNKTENMANRCHTTSSDNFAHGGEKNKLSQCASISSPQAQGTFKVLEKPVQHPPPQAGHKIENSREHVKEESTLESETHPDQPHQPHPLLANTHESSSHQLASFKQVNLGHQVEANETKSSQQAFGGLKQVPARAPFPLLGPGLPADFDPSKALEALEALQAQNLPQPKPTLQSFNLTEPAETARTRSPLDNGQAVTGKAPAAPASCPAPAAPVRQRDATSGLPLMFQMSQFNVPLGLPSMKTLMVDDESKDAKSVGADVVEQQSKSSPVQLDTPPASSTVMPLPTLETLMGRPLSSKEACANKTVFTPISSPGFAPLQQSLNPVASGDCVESKRTAPILEAVPTSQEWDEASACAGHKPANRTLPLGNLDFGETSHAPSVHTREPPSLNLNGYGIQELSSVVSSMKSTPLLTQLHLSCNMIKDVAPIAVFLSTSKIVETVHLSGNQIKDLSPLAMAFSANKTLKHLYLSGNRISDIGPLLALKSNTGLQKLDLSSNVIEKTDPLATALESNSCLSTLLLSRNNIEDICQLCASMRRNSTLQVLGLNGNKINDAKYLADTLRINKGLRQVDLGGNLIGDFVELAEAIPGNGHLQQVVLSGNPGIEHGTMREHLGCDRRIIL